MADVKPSRTFASKQEADAYVQEIVESSGRVTSVRFPDKDVKLALAYSGGAITENPFHRKGDVKAKARKRKLSDTYSRGRLPRGTFVLEEERARTTMSSDEIRRLSNVVSNQEDYEIYTEVYEDGKDFFVRGRHLVNRTGNIAFVPKRQVKARARRRGTWVDDDGNVVEPWTPGATYVDEEGNVLDPPVAKECPLCVDRFASQAELESHLWRQHGKVGREKLEALSRGVLPRISRRTRRSRGPGPGWWRQSKRHAAAARKGWGCRRHYVRTRCKRR